MPKGRTNETNIPGNGSLLVEVALALNVSTYYWEIRQLP